MGVSRERVRAVESHGWNQLSGGAELKESDVASSNITHLNHKRSIVTTILCRTLVVLRLKFDFQKFRKEQQPKPLCERCLQDLVNEQKLSNQGYHNLCGDCCVLKNPPINTNNNKEITPMIQRWV